MYDNAVNAMVAGSQALNCGLEQVAAFAAGALDSLTMGGSSMILGAVVPGYDEFVAGHEAAFTAGSITATVVQAAVMIIATAGAGAGLAVGLIVLKTVIKSAVKTVVKAVERTAVRAVERVGVRAAERAGARGAGRAAESCANSFTAGTPVLMADGTQKPIEDVQVGDDVLATDPETGQTESRPVVGLIRHDGEHTMVELTFDDGSVVTATDEHPFWDASPGAFVYAADLKIGDKVLTADGHTLTITGSRTYQESLTAYNLSIAGIHTYYAGETPVLVHNTCGPIYRGAKPGEAPSFAPKQGEFRVNPDTGFVRDARGVSVSNDASVLSSNGWVPHQVNLSTLSDKLRIVQQGSNSWHHEIVPAIGANLTPQEFISLLMQIGT